MVKHSIFEIPNFLVSLSILKFDFTLNCLQRNTQLSRHVLIIAYCVKYFIELSLVTSLSFEGLIGPHPRYLYSEISNRADNVIS